MGKHIAPEPQKTGTSATQRAAPRVLVVVGLIFVLAGSVLGGFSIFEHKNPIQVFTQSFVATPEQTFGKPNLLVLVEGLDYDYDAKDQEFSTQARSDVIKVANLDFGTKQIYVLSVLRDTAVTYPNGREQKINEAQSDGGTAEAEKVIGGFLGLPPFDRYIVLRIDTAKDMINAIGGVDVNVQNSDPKDTSPISYDDSWGHLHIHLKPGFQHLSGESAVGYMRFRHDWCGDPCRSKRQDQVIKAVTDKLKNNKLNTLMHATDLVGVFHRDVTTNMSNDELLSLASFYLGISPRDVHTAQVPYLGDKILADGGDALVPDDAAKTKLVKAMLIEPPVPEPSPDSMALAAIVPASVRIDVQNGSGISGAARQVAAALKRAGFAIGDVGNAPGDERDTSEIREHSNVTFAGAKVRSALPAALQALPVTNEGQPASPTPSATATSDVTLIVGKDLARAVASASTPSMHP